MTDYKNEFLSFFDFSSWLQDDYDMFKSSIKEILLKKTNNQLEINNSILIIFMNSTKNINCWGQIKVFHYGSKNNKNILRLSVKIEDIQWYHNKFLLYWGEDYYYPAFLPQNIKDETKIIMYKINNILNYNLSI